MLKSCEISGTKYDCKKIFKRIPTDSGICCGMNVDDSLEKSEYSNLITEMQNIESVQKVPAKLVGKKE